MTARRLTLGCAAGLALAAAASWLRFAWERTLRLDTGTVAFVASTVVLGIGLSVAGVCALRLAQIARDGKPGSLLRRAIVVQLCAWPALALTSRDLYLNLAYGVLQLSGHSPYLVGPRAASPGIPSELIASGWLDTPSAYGPVVSAASRAAATVGEWMHAPLWGTGAAFKLEMLLCCLATLLLAAAYVRDHFEERAEAFVMLAFSPLLAWEVSAEAHNDGVLVLSLMAFVWAATSKRELIATLALALGLFAKLATAPILALYLLFIFRRSPTRMLVLGLAATAFGALWLAPYWQGWATLAGSRTELGGHANHHAHSLADLLCLILQPVSATAAAIAYRACWLASLAWCAIIGVRALFRATTVDQVVHDGLILFLAYCLSAPWFQPWYATWLLPLAMAEKDAALRRLVSIYAVLTVVQWALPLDPLTTVAVNAWVAARWYRLRAPAPRPGLAPVLE